ncbi:MAG TPA: CsbD family protein [Solirubrobacterales bacterium]|nr:CsbD family protein [Solirubrobacterales bacterium]
MADDVRNKDDAKGRLKEAAGSLTDDDDLKREGKVDKTTGKVKEGLDRAAERAKEALRRD